MKKFKGFIDAAFKETNERYTIIEEFTLPEDFKTISAFPEGNYLKVVLLQKNNEKAALFRGSFFYVEMICWTRPMRPSSRRTLMPCG